MCEPGFFNPVSGQDQCDRCDIFNFGPGQGLAACTACPTNTKTDYRAATLLSECMCQENYFHPSGLTGEECVACPRT